MKTNELMRLDWVLFDETPCQVTELDEYNVMIGGEIGPIDAMDVYPIPITTKLLENNGWVHRVIGEITSENKIDYWTSPDRRIELHTNENNHLCNSDAKWYLHIDNIDFETVGTGEVTYLHELQNEFNCKHYEFDWKF